MQISARETTPSLMLEGVLGATWPSGALKNRVTVKVLGVPSKVLVNYNNPRQLDRQMLDF